MTKPDAPKDRVQQYLPTYPTYTPGRVPVGTTTAGHVAAGLRTPTASDRATADAVALHARIRIAQTEAVNAHNLAREARRWAYTGVLIGLGAFALAVALTFGWL